MLGKLFPVLLCVSASVGYAEPASYGNALEISPLKAVAGQPSLAVQHTITPGMEGRVFAEYIRQNVQREDYEDSWFTLSPGIDLPLHLEGYLQGLFVGAGLTYQYGLVGETAERAYISSMRPEDKGLEDRWVNEHHYLSAYQAVGYRYFMGDYASVAIRFVLDELLQERSKTVEKDVLSYSVDTTPGKRRAVTQGVSLFAGFHF